MVCYSIILFPLKEVTVDNFARSETVTTATGHGGRRCPLVSDLVDEGSDHYFLLFARLLPNTRSHLFATLLPPHRSTSLLSSPPSWPLPPLSRPPPKSSAQPRSTKSSAREVWQTLAILNPTKMRIPASPSPPPLLSRNI